MISAKKAAALYQKEFIPIENIEARIKDVANDRKYIYAGPISPEVQAILKESGYSLGEQDSDGLIKISW